MAANTTNLLIPLIQAADIYSKDKINLALERIDESVTPVSHKTSAAHWALWESGKPYYTGESVHVEGQSPQMYLQCTTAGTSGATAPAIPVADGGTATDGGVTWTARRLHSHSNLSLLNKLTESGGALLFDGTALYFVPTNKEVLDALTAIDGNLAFGGSKLPFIPINQSVLDQLADSSGVLTYKGSTIGGGAGGNATIKQWLPNTLYSIDEFVVQSDTLYRCLVGHTSSTGVFTDDMTVGNEKWKPISGSGGGVGGIKQVTKMNATAGTIEIIALPWTSTLLLPVVEVLKFIAGAQNQVFTACNFSNADASDFSIDGQSAALSPWHTWDGTMKLKTAYAVSFTTPVALVDGMITESDFIDFSIYESVSTITV